MACRPVSPVAARVDSTRNSTSAQRTGLRQQSGYFRFAAFFAGLASASAAKRCSVRFFAAASDAFLALADRSSAVMVSRLRLPPILPPLLPSWRMTSDINFLLNTPLS
jgi:hypothetical protein